MKTKKILAILISCLLLIGVAVGFTASAADETTVNIVAANVSYDGATRILYTVDAQNLASGSKVQIVFSSDENVAAPSGKLDAAAYEFVSASFGNLTVGGKTYKAVYSDGFEPVEINKKVYAIPVVTDDDDNVVATGNKVGFSVYDYLMTRLAGEYTPEQYLLYVATLDFSGSVQYAEKVTEGKDPAYGYVDAYYGLKIVNADGSVTTQSFREPTEYQFIAPRSFNGKLFEKFVDANGDAIEDADFNKITVVLNKPGYTYVKAVYGETDAVSATIPAGYSETLANPDATPATVKGGSDYYVESGVTLAAGASATLAFNPDVATVTLTENAGKITVSDGVSSFEMANGATLRVEYTVINTTTKKGVLFYYVDGAYVAKSDVTSTANATFTGVTAAAVAGNFTVDGVILGYKAGNVIYSPGTDATVTAEHDGNNKYFVYNKATYNQASAGNLKYYIDGDVAVNKTVFETKMKIKKWFSADWRQFIELSWTQWDGNKTHIMGKMRIRFEDTSTLKIIDVNNASSVLETITLPKALANDEWFDLRIETVSGTDAYVKIYINDELVHTKTSFNTASPYGEYKSVNVREFTFAPYDLGNGSISMYDTKFYPAK